MNRFERTMRDVDALQQRCPPLAVAFGVVKKFGDDNGGTLVSNLAYTGFVCLFPLLLVFITVLNIVLVGDRSLRLSLLHSALGQFPVVGPELGQNIHTLHRSSVLGLVIGLLALLWGTTNLAQAGLFSMAQVWNIPGPERANYWTRLRHSLEFLLVLALGIAISMALAGFGTFGRHEVVLGILSEVLAVAVNVGVYFLAFRVLVPRQIEGARLWPGAVLGGIAWTLLQALGAYLIGHDLRNDTTAYGTFGVVLGLMAWIYIGARLTIYAAELNSVLARNLWPRGMMQPPLTDADQRALTLQATQNQRRPEQEVRVGFSEPPMSQKEWLSVKEQSSE
jgi:YihY family inner membrane protein